MIKQFKVAQIDINKTENIYIKQKDCSVYERVRTQHMYGGTYYYIDKVKEKLLCIDLNGKSDPFIVHAEEISREYYDKTIYCIVDIEYMVKQDSWTLEKKKDWKLSYFSSMPKEKVISLKKVKEKK